LIKIKTVSEIEIMRQGGQILAQVLEHLISISVVGTSADLLNDLAEKIILQFGGQPSFKGFNGYPYSICVSTNREIVHGLPLTNKIFKAGDLVSIDVGLLYKGFHTDAAKSFIIGQPQSKNDVKLIKITESSLMKAVEAIRDGVLLGEISHLVENYVTKNGFKIVKNLSGHGIGEDLQEDPPVFNFGRKNQGPRLKKGMVLAIEPMVVAGSPINFTLADGWTVVTRDGKKAAHFEHTVAVLEKGRQILTR